MIGFAWRIATAPTRFAVGVALDVLFGKEEPFDYPLTGTTPDPFDIAQCAGPTDVYFIFDEAHVWTDIPTTYESVGGRVFCVDSAGGVTY